MQHQGHLVDRGHCTALDHASEIHVAEQGDLVFDLLRHGLIAAANQNVRLDSDLHQLPYGVLGRLGLQLAGDRYVGQQGEVYEQGVISADLLAELSNGLQERQRFDVTHRAADLSNDNVVLGAEASDSALDFVCDVRNDLNGAAEVFTAPFLRNHIQVHPSRCDVVHLGERPIDEPLVMTEVQVGLRAVVRHVDLAVLERRHCAGINVDVGVELLNRDAQPSLDEQASQRSCHDALAQR